ncbi:hypothetical protein EDD17DRAFT_1760477 [Pisolithus thermaeus]|nr:hypothetical protein EV401DRAFT_2084002 [Pisolithus croceorrhizus]KAI6160627.1 hypothetical protein EDD17DRAFT_1760477 [Pisolithus thermaeus]
MSNIALPLEMLDGIMDQLDHTQTHGIWAWDIEAREMVLVILAVLAMLGDNPMQSELGCPIEQFMSPVWRIKGLNPHQDTPVEVLHVILLGFMKYFWHDAISRLTDTQKAELQVRLALFNVSGLGIPPLAGQTLVQYAGSLTGHDFCAISQAALFVLYDLVPCECFEAFLALSSLVPLVWQPSIVNIEEHLVHVTLSFL